MRCKDMFLSSKVAYFPIEEDLQKQEAHIYSVAGQKGQQVKITSGCWVSPSCESSERVLRVELIGFTESKYELQKIRNEKVNRIKEYLKQGKRIDEIAELEGCTPMNIYAMIRRHNLREEIKYENL